MARVQRMLIALAVGLLLAYAAICALLFVKQRSLLYFPQRPPVTGSLERFGIQTVVRDGVTVELLHLPAPAGAPTVVHFHGNAEQVFDQVHFGQQLQKRGLGFAAIEYPGYGTTPGSPTEEGIYRAAEAGLRELLARGVDPASIVLSGRSLGSGVAVELAKRGHGVRVILTAPYTTIPEVGARFYPWLPVRLLARDRFDSLSKAPSIQRPVLIIHGTLDEVIPIELGRELKSAFPEARMVEIEGAHHNDVLDDGADVLDTFSAFARGP